MHMANETDSRANLKTATGVVTSDNRDKTRTVEVGYKVRHPKYGKFLKRRTRYHVHDESNAAKIGDLVEIAHTRPLSKTKAWRLVRVVEKAPTNV